MQIDDPALVKPIESFRSEERRVGKEWRERVWAIHSSKMSGVIGILLNICLFFFFSSRRRHTRSYGDWSSDVCSSDLAPRLERRCFQSQALAKILFPERSCAHVFRTNPSANRNADR